MGRESDGAMDVLNWSKKSVGKTEMTTEMRGRIESSEMPKVALAFVALDLPARLAGGSKSSTE